MRVAVVGALGRMGSEVVRAALEDPEISEVYGVDIREGPSPVKVFRSLSDVPPVDAACEFAKPEATLESLKIASERGIPYLVGTTGHPEGFLEEIKPFAEKIPVLVAPNTSLGVNAVAEALRLLAKALGSYDLEIIEIHHRGKADAPSGTAKMLFGVLREASGRPLKMLTSREGKRSPEEVGVFGVRGGGVFGVHTVYFLGDGEVVELTHRALSRRAFAEGALKALKFLAKARPGLYSMRDILTSDK